MSRFIKSDFPIASCGHCGSDNIDYEGEPEFQDDQIYYNVVCLDCSGKSREWFHLNFVGMWKEVKEKPCSCDEGVICVKCSPYPII
jgi:hypothetical protein